MCFRLFGLRYPPAAAQLVCLLMPCERIERAHLRLGLFRLLSAFQVAQDARLAPSEKGISWIERERPLERRQ